MCKFGILILGGSWKIFFQSSRPMRVGRLAEIESHLEILLKDGCVCGTRMKFGLCNVRRAHKTDI